METPREENDPFVQLVESNQTAERAPSEVYSLGTTESSVEIRRRGCFISQLELTSPSTGDRQSILYSDPDMGIPKLPASHPMMPAGPYDGVGGQHGYPRWVDYRFYDSGAGQAKVLAEHGRDTPCYGKVVELTGNTFKSSAVAENGTEERIRTSLGEHYYFALEDGDFNGLTLDGLSLEEVFGSDALPRLMDGQTLVLNNFDRAIIKFPVGHSIKLSAGFEGLSDIPVGLWVWHRVGTPSVCFEPVVGVRGGNNQGILIAPGASVTLSTAIELI